MRASALKKNASIKQRAPLFESLEDRKLFTAYTVNPSNPITGNNYGTISAAVAAVNSPNSTITVSAGTYAEQVFVPSGSQYTGLQIIGAGSAYSGPTIQPTSVPNNNHAIVEVQATNVTIYNFDITGGSSGVDGLVAGVMLDGSSSASAVISDDSLSNIKETAAHFSDATYGYGIDISTGTAQITGCNISSYQRLGILVAPAVEPPTVTSPSANTPVATITSCNVTGLGALSTGITGMVGIVFDTGARGSVTNTNISGNYNPSYTSGIQASTGLELDDAGLVGVTGGSITGNDTNVQIYQSDLAGNYYYGSKQFQLRSVSISNAYYDGIDVYGASKGILLNLTDSSNAGNGLYIGKDPLTSTYASQNTIQSCHFLANDATNLYGSSNPAQIEDDTAGAAGPNSYGTADTYVSDSFSSGSITDSYNLYAPN